jgi:hypothetical protein
VPIVCALMLGPGGFAFGLMCRGALACVVMLLGMRVCRARRA